MSRLATMMATSGFISAQTSDAAGACQQKTDLTWEMIAPRRSTNAALLCADDDGRLIAMPTESDRIIS